MIQRIQTAFLIIATILLVFMVFMPVASVVRPTDEVVFELGFKGLESADGVKEPFTSYPMSILVLICLAICITTIFLFKRRMLQIRLCVVNIVLLLGLQGLVYYFAKAAQSSIDGNLSFSLLFVFPLISAILVFLALRAVARDEALVRSLDRLR
ncbi:MAG: DUF4293 domain-containing protein [Tenuifilaceae bacterium]|jgi:hypothetical protein|nr:DUF4293 domain-containing protein [Tenuifilaceae bacterium]